MPSHGLLLCTRFGLDAVTVGPSDLLGVRVCLNSNRGKSEKVRCSAPSSSAVLYLFQHRACFCVVFGFAFFVQALCMLLGSGGARSVEKAVLDFVATRVREMQVRCGTAWHGVCGASF